MKTLKEMQSMYKEEGLFVNHDSFNLPTEIKDILDWASKFYSYVIVLEEDVTYLFHISCDAEYSHVYEGKEGFIDFLDSWVFTFEENLNDMEEGYHDVLVISSEGQTYHKCEESEKEFYRTKIKALSTFIETLK